MEEPGAYQRANKAGRQGDKFMHTEFACCSTEGLIGCGRRRRGFSTGLGGCRRATVLGIGLILFFNAGIGVVAIFQRVVLLDVESLGGVVPIP